MLNSREIASVILSEVYQGTTLDTSMSKNKNFLKLSNRDRSLVNLIVMTSLRRHGEVDIIISNFIKKPFKKKDLVNHILQISVAQLIFLDFPDYSVVNTAVEISKKYGSEKFVNAILRNILRKKKGLIKKTNTITNIPSWLKDDLLKNFNNEKLKLIADRIVEEPFIDIKIKEEVLTKFDWEKILDGHYILKDLIRLKNKKKVDDLPYYNQGLWWVQGIASTFPVKIINKIFRNTNKSKINVLDVGASPGGKTFQLVEAGYIVKALEVSSKRTQMLKDNCNRVKLTPIILNENFLDFKESEKFDCILIDAPCSGSGIVQKKPEILITKKSLKDLILKQNLMLSHAKKILKSGGYLIYSVCSIISDEGETQVNNFLKENQNFSTVSPFEDLKKFTAKKNSKYFLTTPDKYNNHGGIDGFFIACLRKNH